MSSDTEDDSMTFPDEQRTTSFMGIFEYSNVAISDADFLPLYCTFSDIVIKKKIGSILKDTQYYKCCFDSVKGTLTFYAFDNNGGFCDTLKRLLQLQPDVVADLAESWKSQIENKSHMDDKVKVDENNDATYFKNWKKMKRAFYIRGKGDTELFNMIIVAYNQLHYTPNNCICKITIKEALRTELY